MSRSLFLSFLISCVLIATTLCVAHAATPMRWESKQLVNRFYSEGAAAGDIDGDGHVDLVYGPMWFRGPDFTDSFTIYPPVEFDPVKYSDNFFSYIVDANGDGLQDVIVLGFPGKEARLYVNPGAPKDAARWQSIVIADQVDNESPTFVDLIPGGLPEIVCARGGAYGYYMAKENSLEPWTWIPVTGIEVGAQRFTHGLGVGDVDGDGRLDILDRQFWWSQPEMVDGLDRPSGLWSMQRWNVGDYRGGAQILIDDCNEDGLNDIITSIDAHGYGLSWFEQRQSKDGSRTFIRHDILGDSSIENPYGVVFSQLHALSLSDIDGDGKRDLVTGKRYWAHASHDPGALQSPVLYWFRRMIIDGNVVFEPHLVDDHSGVGVDVLVADLNGDNHPDLVSSNKLGLTIHLQERNDGPETIIPWADKELLAGVVNGPSQSLETAASTMRVPPGFAVDLIAGEPQLKQPIAMCFDAKGRIWVAEGHTYPTRAPEGQGRDRIVIFEDADRDGTFEKQTEFISGLNLVSGIEVGFGGVWVGAAPYFMFIPDADGDDKPDSEPQILLDGWGYHDTHETLNSFRWGPDGWLYGCHGVFTRSSVGKPGTEDAKRTRLNAAIWRYHPTRHEFEVFAEGSSNPWGLDFNDRGDWFMECCVIPHLFHVIQGARYHRQAGQHFNPYIYEDIPTIADHLHYGDGSFDSMMVDGKVDRRLVNDGPEATSIVGGGHAHCGMTIYQGDSFPDSYRGDLFFYNLHGHRMVRDAVVRDGSGYVGHHRPDFIRTFDESFVGVGIMLGPDGSLFFSDWHDPQTCHNVKPEIWDRSNGRLYRVRFGDLKSTSLDLPSLSDLELVGLLAHRNAMIARTAARLLQERSVEGTLDRQAVNESLVAMMSTKSTAPDRLRAMWARWSCQLLDNVELLHLTNDKDEFVRGWAVQFLAEEPQKQTAEVWQWLAELARKESSPVTRRYLASALQRCPIEHAWPLADALVSQNRDSDDRNLPWMIWYGVEPLVASDPVGAIDELLPNMKIERVAGFVRRRAAVTEPGRDALVAAMKDLKAPLVMTKAMQQFHQALPLRGDVSTPKNWADVREQAFSMAKNAKPEPVRLALVNSVWSLAARLGDPNSFEYFRKVAKNDQQSPDMRTDALRSLQSARDPELAKLCATLLIESKMSDVALAMIADIADPSAAESVIKHFGSLSPKGQTTAINFLCARRETAAAMIAATDSKQIDRTLVSPVMLRQMQALRDPVINFGIERIWGKLGDVPADLARQKNQWLVQLTDGRLAKADVERGRGVFKQVCGACHLLKGEGYAIGPDLTGSNRGNIEYLLDNVLAPNAVIGAAYQLSLFLMQDGRVISGLIRSEDDQSFRVVMAGGTEVTLAKDEVETHEVSKQSMMPTGLFEKLGPQDVADLVAFLKN